MQKVLECVPNFSTGNPKKLASVIKSIEKIRGVKILDFTGDKDHNRSVITFIGEPEKVVTAAFEAAKTASRLIDLTKHKGVHPRIGATDVMPLIPLKNITEKEAVKYSKKLGEKIAKELKIPVYFYEKSATTPKRKNLADVRNIGYEQLKKEISKNKERFPDLGPKKLGKAGAIAIGVRDILIAFNINLKTNNLEIAKKIAAKIREKSGGLKYVKALGLMLKTRNIAQISMNLTNYKKTGISKVFKAVQKEAKKHNVEILESEIIGMIPKDAFKNTAPKKLKLLQNKPLPSIMLPAL
ncbi:MAG: glutamate formimidoyltransferase [Candidatus Gracilibacteria bacterium]|jgi:glutamate formiminotransferase